MEWVWVLIAVVVVVTWRLSRVPDEPSGPRHSGSAVRSAGPVAGAAVGGVMAPPAVAGARGMLDPDNPDGAFMDGYVAGRYTERWEQRASPVESPTSGRPDHVRPELGDEDDTTLDDGSMEDDTLDDQWGSGWSDHAGASRHGSHDVWSDPDDAFHDDSSDDW